MTKTLRDRLQHALRVNGYRPMAEDVALLDGLCDAAEGNESKTWCEHLQLELIADKLLWVFTDLGGRTFTDWNDVWTVCPICEAKRPC